MAIASAAPRLRPYQLDAQRAIVDARRRGIRTQLVSIATGLGKCVDPQTWIWSNGLRRFGDAWGAQQIAGPHANDRVMGWYDDGVNPGKRIVTAHGFSIDGTLAHRVWIRRDDGFEGWCTMADLRHGDYLAIARGRADFGTVDFPLEEAYLLGLAIADGCIVKTGPRAHRLQNDGHPELVARVTATMETWRAAAGGQRNGGVSVTTKSPDHVYAVVHAKRLKEHIEESFGVRWTYSPDRVVPDAVLNGTRDVVRAFLRGYFDGDGVADPIVACNTASYVLAQQVQQLLLGLGVFCGLRTRTSTQGLPSHMVLVYDPGAFAREVGFTTIGRAKDRFFEATLERTRNPNHDVVPGVGALLRTLAQERPAKHRSSDHRQIRAYYDETGWRRPSYAQLRRFIADAPDSAERRELQRIVDEHRAWTPVTRIEDSAIRRIDCEIEHSHAFVGNGLINHNTVIIATLPKLLELRPNDVTLVVAHRDELIEQIFSKMRAANPNAKIGIEKAEQRAAEDCEIVVATVQTLGEKRLAEFSARFGRRIALFVIDEAHHAAAPSYRAVVDAITAKRTDAMVMGFTATPNRGDGVGLIDVFQTIVYSMDTRQAIEQGYLVPVRSFAVATKTNLDDVASRGGDFVVGQLAAAVNTADRNARIVDAYKRHTPDQKALVFTASVEHARSVYESFAGAGVAAAFASGETPKDERERIVADFRGDVIDVLVNCGLYLEGFDVPGIRVVINARPTKSTSLYTQITGRALRPVDEIADALSDLDGNGARRALIADSPKPYAMILDMVDQAHRHQLVTLPSLYGLPPQIDAQGRPVSYVAERFEELLKRAPREAARVRTAEQIETALFELDETEERSSSGTHVAAWQPIEPEHWRLDRPAQKTARDRKGRPIPNFAKIYEQFVGEAKRIAPHENAEAFAQRILDVDARSIREEQIRIDVFRRGKEIITTVTNGSGPAREIATNTTLAAAIGEAELRVDEALRAQTPSSAQAKNAQARRARRGRRRRRPVTAAAATNGKATVQKENGQIEHVAAGYLDFGDWSAAEI